MTRAKEIVRQFHEFTETANKDRLMPLIADDFQMFGPGMLEPLPFAQAIEVGGTFLAAFPGARSSLEEQVEEGDLVVTRGVYRGTNSGPFMGIPATGLQVAVPWVSIDRVRDGRIVEHRFLMDMQVMMQQLGMSSGPLSPAS
jgi:predicted ester cyclase